MAPSNSASIEINKLYHYPESPVNVAMLLDIGPGGLGSAVLDALRAPMRIDAGIGHLAGAPTGPRAGEARIGPADGDAHASPGCGDRDRRAV
jgi:hypothetical protein